MKQLPKRKATVTQERSKVVKETENPFDDDDEDEHSPKRGESSKASAPPYEQNMKTVQSFSQSGHSRSASGSGSFFGSSSSKDKKKKEKKTKKRRPFNLEAEKDQMKATIAESSIAATNLMNTLKSINREKERISENQTAVQGFESCKQLRRKILRYVCRLPHNSNLIAKANQLTPLLQIHHVESEQYLGSLLHANDELILALMTYEQLDRSIDADSDSEDELAEQAHLYRSMMSSRNFSFLCYPL